MSYINTQASSSYKEAVEATESIEAPALGFIRPIDHKGAQSGTTAVIKQNNTQLHLLVLIAEKLEKIEEKIQKLETKADKAPATIPEDILTKLQNLTISDRQRPKEEKGQLKVFVDPYKILKEEKAKSKK